MKKPLNLPLLILGGLGAFWAFNKLAKKTGEEGLKEMGRNLGKVYESRNDQAIKDALK